VVLDVRAPVPTARATSLRRPRLKIELAVGPAYLERRRLLSTSTPPAGRPCPKAAQLVALEALKRTQFPSATPAGPAAATAAAAAAPAAPPPASAASARSASVLAALSSSKLWKATKPSGTSGGGNHVILETSFSTTTKPASGGSPSEHRSVVYTFTAGAAPRSASASLPPFRPPRPLRPSFRRAASAFPSASVDSSKS
jgi:hypothetical protein